MSILTKEDVQGFVRETLGDDMAEMKKTLTNLVEKKESSPVRKYTQPFMVEEESKLQHKLATSKAGTNAARYIRLLAAGRGDPGRAASIAKSWGDDYMAKSLNESVLDAGGALVPEEFMSEIIELLRAKAVVRSMGAMSVPMNRGSITMPFQSAAATAAYVGELQNIPTSQPSFGQLTLSAKKLVSLVPISNDLIKDSSSNVDQIVRNDLVATMALREDIAFIRGNGASNTPKGMRHWALPANVFAATGVTLADITNDLFTAMTNLENLNVPLSNAGWIFPPRTKSGIMRIRDGNGNFVFRDEMLRGTLMGFRYQTTTQIPTNLGGGGNETEIYFADFSSLMIAESSALEISVYEGGAFSDGGNIVSGISSDQTVIKALSRHDFGARQRGEEISVITGVTYGV